MNVYEYLNHPVWRNPSRKDELEKRFKELMATNKFNVRIYIHKNKYIYHVAVPSKSNKEILYDIIVEIDGLRSADDDIEKANAKFFSNAPSFVYGGYMKNYKHHRAFVNWTTMKIYKFTLPRITDQRQFYAESTIYFALKYLHQTQKFRYGTIKTSGINISGTNSIYNNIRSFEQIREMHEISKKDEEKGLRTPRKFRSNFSAKVATNPTQKNKDSTLFGKTIKTIGKTKKVNSTAKTKKTAKVKKI